MYRVFRFPNDKKVIAIVNPVLVNGARDVTEAKNMFEVANPLTTYNNQTGEYTPGDPTKYTTVVEAVTEAQ